MNLSTKQKQTHRQGEQPCVCQGGEGWERDGVGPAEGLALQGEGHQGWETIRLIKTVI